MEEVREGISYGANTIRDGVSIQRIEVQKPVVPASEIQRLNDLTCYVRLPGSYPITLLHMPYLVRPIQQAGFVDREFEPDPLRQDLQSMMDSQAAVAPSSENTNNKAAPATQTHSANTVGQEQKNALEKKNPFLEGQAFD